MPLRFFIIDSALFPGTRFDVDRYISISFVTEEIGLPKQIVCGDATAIYEPFSRRHSLFRPA
jgi:hypothetical protein